MLYSDTLPEGRDMLFKPKCQLSLGLAGIILAHIVDSSLHQTQIMNDTDSDVTIPRRARLRAVEELYHNGCSVVEIPGADLAAGGPASRIGKGAALR